MFEKVNPAHPDKQADRIAGALVDLAYAKDKNPKIAVEVLLGHGVCHIICETSTNIGHQEAQAIVERIAGSGVALDWRCELQDQHLHDNQIGKIRCGDNGIFLGMPLTEEEKELSQIARKIYDLYPFDGKYILDKEQNRLIVCQSHMRGRVMVQDYDVTTNPLGYWTGGPDVDSGATNRKLGSDMGRSITGGGLHGKDLSKADVSVNVYAWMTAQITKEPVRIFCAIGDEEIVCFGRKIPYQEVVDAARAFIQDDLGGFEKFAEWGLF